MKKKHKIQNSTARLQKSSFKNMADQTLFSNDFIRDSVISTLEDQSIKDGDSEASSELNHTLGPAKLSNGGASKRNSLVIS